MVNMTGVQDYRAPAYMPPKVIEVVGGILDIRSSSFPDLFSSDRQAQQAYVKQYIGIGVLVLVFVFLWFTTLVSLKCKGQDVGCASGRAFRRSPSKLSSKSDTDDSSDSNSKDSLEEYNEKEPYKELPPPIPPPTSAMIVDYDRELEATVEPIPMDVDESRSKSSSRGCCSDRPRHVRTRKLRTRVVFLFFGALSVTCGVLLLRFTYEPLMDASSGASDVILESQQVADGIQNMLQLTKRAANVAEGILDDLPLDVSRFCPDIPPSRLHQELGVDARGIVRFFEGEYDSFLDSTRETIQSAEEASLGIVELLHNAEIAVKRTEEQLWTLPFGICVVMTITVLSMSAVGLAVYRQECNSRSSHDQIRPTMTCAERTTSWIILPLFIALTVISWVFVVSLSFGTIVITDICIAPGTPSASIQFILEAQGFEDPTALSYLAAYTGGCRGANPTEELERLHQIIDDHLVLMENTLEEAKSVGYDTMNFRCGRGNRLEQLFSGVSTLERELKTVSVALGDTREALSCPRIHSLYSRFVEEAFCTDLAIATSSGFVLMLGVSVSSMIMITLRASWRD